MEVRGVLAVIPVVDSIFPLVLFIACMNGKFAGRLFVGYYNLYLKERKQHA